MASESSARIQSLRKGYALKSRSRFVRSRHLPVIAIFFLFFVAFNRYFHFLIGEFLRHFSGANTTWFVERWQLDSDMLIRTRLQSNLDDGVFAHLFSLGNSGEYLSQVGFGGWILTLPVTLLHEVGLLAPADYTLPAPEIGFSGFFGLGILYSLIALLNSFVATWCTLKLAQLHSVAGAVIFATFLLQPWSLAINSSLYWMFGLKLLPGIFMFEMLQRQKQFMTKTWVCLFFLTFCTFLSGYEFSTLVVVTILTPCIFLLIRENRKISENIAFLVLPLTISIVAFVAAIFQHLAILSLKFGSFSQATEQLQTIVYKRTGAGAIEVDQIYAGSLESSPALVLQKYLTMPVFGDPVSLGPIQEFRVWHFLIIVTLVWAWRTCFSSDEVQFRMQLALGTAWLFGLIGPFGWFLLARPHSAGHVHIDFALWFFFTIPMGTVLLYGKIPRFTTKNRGLKDISTSVATITILISMMFVISQFLSSSNG